MAAAEPVLVHDRMQRQHIHGVEATADQIKERHDFEGGNLRVEGFGIFEVVVSHLTDHIAEELSTATFGCFVVVVVFKFGLVGCFRADADHSWGIVSDEFIIEG